MLFLHPIVALLVTIMGFEDRQPPESNGAKQGRRHPAQRRLEQAAQVEAAKELLQTEIEAVRESALYILETVVNELCDLQSIDGCASVWASFKDRASKTLLDAQSTIEKLSVFANDSAPISHKELTKLRARTPEIADTVLKLTNSILRLSKEIVDTGYPPSVCVDENETPTPSGKLKDTLFQKLDRLADESSATLQLFSAQRGSRMTAFDLIAGCAFGRCRVHAQGGESGTLESAHLAVNPESAAAALFISMSVLDRIRHSLFTRCLLTETGEGELLPSIQAAREVFRKLTSPEGNPTLSALCAIAKQRPALQCSLNGDGQVEVSLVLPTEAQHLGQTAIMALSKELLLEGDTFEMLGISHSLNAKLSEQGFELAVVLDVPLHDKSAEPLRATQSVFVDHGTSSRTAPAITRQDVVTFECHNNGVPVQVQFARSLFYPLRGGEGEFSYSPNLLQLAVNALRIGESFDHGRYLNVVGEPTLIERDGRYVAVPGYVVSVGRPESPGLSLSEVAHGDTVRDVLKHWLQEPDLRTNLISGLPVTVAFQAPIQFAHDKGFRSELKRLAQIVTIGQLAVPFLRDIQDERTLDTGVRFIRDLCDLLESDDEIQRAAERPQLIGTLAKSEDGAAHLDFYLISSDSGLRGLGRLPIGLESVADVATLTHFSDAIHAKSIALIKACEASLAELSSSQGPPESRLVDALLRRGFALSLDIARSVVDHHSRRLSSLTPPVLAGLVFSEIARGSGVFGVSEDFAFRGEKPFTLSVLTAAERVRWTS